MSEAANNEFRQVFRSDILRAYLKYARSCRSRYGEYCPEVEIVRNDDVAIFLGPIHYFGVRSAAVSDRGPVDRGEAVGFERPNPQRGQVHVDQDLHTEASGISISSTRHAA